MRADESTQQRGIQRAALASYLDTLEPGCFVPMTEWYGRMAQLGLVHSHRQRLSELREQGYRMAHKRSRGGYVFYGKVEDTQEILPIQLEGKRCPA